MNLVLKFSGQLCISHMRASRQSLVYEATLLVHHVDAATVLPYTILMTFACSGNDMDIDCLAVLEVGLSSLPGLTHLNFR